MSEARLELHLRCVHLVARLVAPRVTWIRHVDMRELASSRWKRSRAVDVDESRSAGKLRLRRMMVAGDLEDAQDASHELLLYALILVHAVQVRGAEAGPLLQPRKPRLEIRHSHFPNSQLHF